MELQLIDDTLVARAALLIELRRYREAIPLLHQALLAAPDSSVVLCHLAVAHCSLGELKQAHDFAGKAIAADPEMAWAYRALCAIYQLQGKASLALEAAEKAYCLLPESAESLYILAMAQHLRKRRREARRTAERLCAFAPDSPLGYQALGTVALSERYTHEAEMHFRHALSLEPNDAGAMNGLGAALLRQNLWDEALECFYSAAALDPEMKLARESFTSNLHFYLGTRYSESIMRFALLTLLVFIPTGRLVLTGIAERDWLQVFEGSALMALYTAAIFLYRRYRSQRLPAVVRLYLRQQGFGWWSALMIRARALTIALIMFVPFMITLWIAMLWGSWIFGLSVIVGSMLLLILSIWGSRRN